MKLFKSTSKVVLKTMAIGSLLFMSSIYSSCRKPHLDKPQPKLISGEIKLNPQFSMEEIISRLPQTVLYNLGDKVIFYINESKTIADESGIALFFPINKNKTRFLYAVKDNRNEMRLYLRVIYEEAGSYEDGNYNAIEEILDLQTYEIYPQKFENNNLVAIKAPIKIAEPYWETCMLENGLFTFDSDLKIVLDSIKINTYAGKPGKGKYGCIFNQHGDNTKGIIGRISNWLGGIFNSGNGGDGDYGNGGGAAPWHPDGGNWTSPNTGGGSSGGSSGGGGIGSPNLNNPLFNQPKSAPGFENGNNTIFNPTQETSQALEIADYKDSKGFIINRKTALTVQLQSEPYSAIDCDLINQIPGLFNIFQEIGSLIPSNNILSKIDSINNNFNNYGYNTNNTYIQKITDGIGVVNMDLFPIHITQLPNFVNGQQMSAKELLEYFRTSILEFTLNNTTSFYPYQDNQSGNPPNFVDYFNLPYNQSEGAWGRFQIMGQVPIIDTVYNNGTVILSQYFLDEVNEHYWFTFSTMASRLDGWHPVAGNRRFGIKKHSTGYQFYIAGVDRIWDLYGFLANNFNNNMIFNGADNLWTQVQINLINFINTNQGSSGYQNPVNFRARIPWNKVEDFLLGHISLQTLKSLLGCN